MLKVKTPSSAYAELERLPPNIVGEILFGVLHTHPRPSPRHGVASSVIGHEIMGPYQFGRGGPGGWIFIDEPEVHLGPHVVVPDIAGWRRERLTPFPDTAYILTAPDWIAEVLSPSTQAVDRTDKLKIYAEFGVGHLWYVDPTARTLEVMALTNGRWMLAATFKDADRVAAPPFEAHSFLLDGLWIPADRGGELA